MDDCVAAVEREHVGIGAVVENCLERVPTMFSDADDQHVVIIAQGSCERRIRAPSHGEGAGRGVLSSV
jgi:hypothetical protein